MEFENFRFEIIFFFFFFFSFVERMDEIAKLQEEFMRLQKQQASHSISERVCVEILLKLIQREKVKVYYTFDVKEYPGNSNLGSYP